MAKLNQILAVEKGAKATLNTGVTEVYHTITRPGVFDGQDRVYTPLDDDPTAERLPSESQKVVAAIPDLLTTLATDMGRLADLTATKMTANTRAAADVVVNGVTVLEQIPVEFLLTLEGYFQDLATIVKKMPTTDPTVVWTYNKNTGLWDSLPTETKRGKKIPRSFIKAPATDKFPAQAEMYYEDQQVGTWTTIKHSGALSPARKRQLLERIAAWSAAVKMAREEANSTEAPNVEVGKVIFKHLLAE